MNIKWYANKNISTWCARSSWIACIISCCNDSSMFMIPSIYCCFASQFTAHPNMSWISRPASRIYKEHIVLMIISKQGLSIIVKELLIDIPISWRFPSAALVTSGCTKSLLKWIPKTSELYSSIALETFFRLLARRRLLSEGISPRILDTHSIQIKLNIVESLLIEVFR